MHLEGELMMHDLYGAHLLNIVLQCCMLFIIIIIIFFCTLGSIDPEG